MHVLAGVLHQGVMLGPPSASHGSLDLMWLSAHRGAGSEASEFQNILSKCFEVVAPISDLKNGLVCPNTYLLFQDYGLV